MEKMPKFYFHFNDGAEVYPDEIGLRFINVEAAYLEVCATIPGMAQDILVKRKDPLAASYVIADHKGRTLMTVPFTDILAPSEWHLAKARRRPHGGSRSNHSRDAQALASFRRMFGSVPMGCVLITPEMQVVEMNDFGVRHAHVDAEAIRGQSIFDIFTDMRDGPKSDFERFISLAQAGAASQLTDLPYLVLDEDGQTTNGWWNARAWPILDDDAHLIGFVDLAEPSTAPRFGGRTEVRVCKRSA